MFIYDGPCCYSVIIYENRIMDVEKCERQFEWKVSFDRGESYTYLCNKHFNKILNFYPMHRLLFSRISTEDINKNEYAREENIYQKY